MKGHLDIKELERYKKADIQKLARDLGVSDAGTVKEIAARCAAVEVEVSEEELTEEEKAALQQEEAQTAADQATGETAAAVGQSEEGPEPAEEEPQTGQGTAKEDEPEETTNETQKAQETANEAPGKVLVEAVTRYLDKQFNQIMEAGEIFAVDCDRAAVLVAAGVVKTQRFGREGLHDNDHF